jgi:hypothetical protein
VIIVSGVSARLGRQRQRGADGLSPRARSLTWGDGRAGLARRDVFAMVAVVSAPAGQRIGRDRSRYEQQELPQEPRFDGEGTERELRRLLRRRAPSIAAKRVEALCAMARRTDEDGRFAFVQDEIAREVGCDERTVRYALEDGERLRLLSHEPVRPAPGGTCEDSREVEGGGFWARFDACSQAARSRAMVEHVRHCRRANFQRCTRMGKKGRPYTVVRCLKCGQEVKGRGCPVHNGHTAGRWFALTTAELRTRLRVQRGADDYRPGERTNEPKTRPLVSAKRTEHDNARVTARLHVIVGRHRPPLDGRNPRRRARLLGGLKIPVSAVRFRLWARGIPAERRRLAFAAPCTLTGSDEASVIACGIAPPRPAIDPSSLCRPSPSERLLDQDPSLDLEKGNRLSSPAPESSLTEDKRTHRLSSDARARGTETERAASPSARKVSSGSETRDDDAAPTRSADGGREARLRPASTPTPPAAYAQRDARARALVATAIALGIVVDDQEIARRTFLARFAEAALCGWTLETSFETFGEALQWLALDGETRARLGETGHKPPKQPIAYYFGSAGSRIRTEPGTLGPTLFNLRYFAHMARSHLSTPQQRAVLAEAWRMTAAPLERDVDTEDIVEVPIVRVAAVIAQQRGEPPPPAPAGADADVQAALRDRDPAALAEALERAVAARRGALP